jgi:uncharacterized protein (DUF3084 family)
MIMDLNSEYKQAKQIATELANRENELKKRIEKIKELKAQNEIRRNNILALEATLAKELKSF